MNNSFLSAEEALAVDQLMPGLQLYSIGSKLKNALASIRPVRSTYYVDGTNGSDSNDGLSYDTAFKTIQYAVTSASAYDTICIIPKAIVVGATDPNSYAETIIIPATHEGLTLIGYGSPGVQGAIPQIKKGSGTTALITVRAPGCTIANLGINGSGSTGGGILLDDNGTTKNAFGTVIAGCHFKNCVGTTATDSRTGGAIQWSATGGAWQVRISGNRFYKNVCDVVLLGTSGSVPQDVVIEGNVFSGPAANTDCNLYLAGGSGMNGLIIKDNVFTAKPAIGSGSVALFVDLTGCVGMFCNNLFAGTGTTTGYGVSKASADIPVTMFITKCYSESGLIVREA